MLKGGYIVVDAKGIDLTGGSTPQEIVGIWDTAVEAIESGKPIVVENLVYGSGVHVSPVNAFGWYLDTDEIVFVSATIHVHIHNDDTVTTIDVVD